MWNTDPVIVVGVLLAIIGLLVCFSGLQCLMIRRCQAEAAYDAETIRFLRQELNAAQRNDHRDTNGRYASPGYNNDGPCPCVDCRAKRSLEDVCVNPANYPANR